MHPIYFFRFPKRPINRNFANFNKKKFSHLLLKYGMSSELKGKLIYYLLFHKKTFNKSRICTERSFASNQVNQNGIYAKNFTFTFFEAIRNRMLRASMCICEFIGEFHQHEIWVDESRSHEYFDHHIYQVVNLMKIDNIHQSKIFVCSTCD